MDVRSAASRILTGLVICFTSWRASLRRAGRQGTEETVAFGLLLVVIGLLLLLDSLNLIEGVGFEELWPVLLIVIGVAIIYDRVRRSWRRR